MKSVVPPVSVAREAARGLKLRASLPPSRRCCTTVGLRRASQLKNRQPVSVNTLKRMKAYFDRHRVDRKGRGWGVDSKGYQAWLLWGGDAGYAWAKKMLKQYEPNVFRARPEEFAGRVTHGVVRYPGFHTASDPETTFPYAQYKAVPDDLDEEMDVLAPDEVTIGDYPVVIALDMRGMKRLVDYDAVEYVKPVLTDIAKQIVREGGDPMDELVSYVESGDYGERGVPDNVMQWLFEHGTQAQIDPSGALLSCAEEQRDPSAFIRAVADGSITDEKLAIITGQFRYDQDVPSSRITKVSYLKPWFPRVFYCTAAENEADCELVDALSDAGWSTVDEDDILSGVLYDDRHDVFERDAPYTARIEYHGTSYRNLIKAAPDIDWPVPPHPYA